MKRMQGLLVVVTLLFAITAHAKTASEVFDAVSSSIVVVRSYDANGKDRVFGSGVFLCMTIEDEVLGSNVIATNCHVIRNAAEIKVMHKGIEYPATLRHSDWDRDVCTLTVSGIEAPGVKMGSTSRLKVGARVYAIGAPKGLELTLSEGIISSLRPVEGGQYLQISAPISPGSSGGGLFDEEGRLIGLPTFYLAEGQQLNFAVPVEWISELPERQKKEVKSAETPTTDWLNKAFALEEKDDWAGLITHSLRWTKTQPEDPLAWHFLGDAYVQSGKTPKAIEAYQKAVRIFPGNFIVWFNLGTLYLSSDKTAKAIEALQKAVRLHPEYSKAWINLGSVYWKSGQTAKAIEACQQAVRVNPESADGWRFLSAAYLESGKTAKAIEACQQLVRIDPEKADAWHNLGVAYHKSGQTAKAIECFQKALHIDSEADILWQNLGRIYLESRQNAKAIESYQEALRINPENAIAWADLGNAYGNSRQFAKAIESYQQALRIKPKNTLTWFNLGLAYKYSGQTSKVMEVYKRLKTLDPAKADEFFNKIVLP